jgi:hypothetical protein
MLSAQVGILLIHIVDVVRSHSDRWGRKMRTPLVIVAFLLVEAGSIAQTTETPIWSFGGNPDGAYPGASVVVDPKTGIIYGVTSKGGKYSNGTVFQLTPPAAAGGLWSEQILYSFQNKGDGQNPNSLVESPNGDLYGTTLYGGSSGESVVFELSKAGSGGGWNETVIFDCTVQNLGLPAYAGGVGGPITNGALVLDNTGNLYAMLTYYGSVIVEFGPPSTSGGKWTATILYGGLVPPNFYYLLAQGLILDNSTGSLYGSDTSGGNGSLPSSVGNLFHLSPPESAGGAWSYSDIYDFGYPSNLGAFWPVGGLVLLNGSIYGTTAADNLWQGAVYQAVSSGPPGAPWTANLLFGFSGGTNGQYPMGGLIAVNGALYGTTSGWPTYAGTIFMMYPWKGSWTGANLYSFQNGADGASPRTALTAAPNNSQNGTTVTLYGTTLWGGPSSVGTVFEAIVPSAAAATATEPRIVAVCNVNCFENSVGWKFQPPISVLGPEAVAFDGNVVEVSEGGRNVEVEARMLGGLMQSPVGSARTMRITFDRDGLLKVGQRVSIVAKGPVMGISSRLEVLGVWPSGRPSSATQK